MFQALEFDGGEPWQRVSDAPLKVQQRDMRSAGVRKSNELVLSVPFLPNKTGNGLDSETTARY